MVQKPGDPKPDPPGEGCSAPESVTRPAGWNIIAAPEGTTINVGPLYSVRPGAAYYDVLPAGSEAEAGVGYWAFFDANSETYFPLESPSYSVRLPANQWMLIGNSGDDPAIVTGADEVFIYDTVSDAYIETYTIPAYTGAWAISYTGAVVTIKP